MGEVLEKYDVKFYEELVLDEYEPMMSSIDAILSWFISDFSDSDNVNEFIIDRIDNVLDGTDLERTAATQCMVYLKITIDTCTIYQNYINDAYPSFTLPTKDFREIALSWRHYLQVNGY
jgi:hypothetical protein